MKQIYGPKIDINNTEVFTMQNEHSYAAFVGVLSNIYMKAHASANFRSVPYTAAIVIDKTMSCPYKKQPESSFDRLKAIIPKLKAPKGDINLGIFIGNSTSFNPKSTVGLKHTVSQSWPLNITLNERNTITVNLPPKPLNNGSNTKRFFTKEQVVQHLKSEKLKFVDYNTPINQLFESFQHSKVHMCYQGGSAWLSISASIPTIVIHPTPFNKELHLKNKLFGQDLGNINILNNNLIEHVRSHPFEHHTYIKNLRKTLNRLL